MILHVCTTNIQEPHIGFGTRRNEYEQDMNCLEFIELKQKPANIRSTSPANYVDRVSGSSVGSKCRQKLLISCSTGRATSLGSSHGRASSRCLRTICPTLNICHNFHISSQALQTTFSSHHIHTLGFIESPYLTDSSEHNKCHYFDDGFV